MKKEKINDHTVFNGDCIEVMDKLIKAGVKVESIVTDPPYHLTSGNNKKGFMGKEWDGGGIAFQVETWKRCYDLLKPGGYLLAFSGSRTYHRMACAIEDAGFEIRDRIRYECSYDTKYGALMDSLNDEQRGAVLEMLNDVTGGSELAWEYGTGFPKSHNVSVAIDKAAGAERKVIGKKKAGIANPDDVDRHTIGGSKAVEVDITEPATPEAKQWEGWGSSLKPAHEPIVLARKPLEGTIAANVLKHGTGAINIDACRVATTENPNGGGYDPNSNSRKDLANATSYAIKVMTREFKQPTGRFPANVIHDGSDEVLDEFATYGVRQGSTGTIIRKRSLGYQSDVNYAGRSEAIAGYGYGDTGTVARFFYSAKASKKDRAGSKHPTVKPVNLIRYLATLVTAPGGTVMDPFAGSGSLGGAWPKTILIEREEEYFNDILNRLKNNEPDEEETVEGKNDLTSFFGDE